MNAIEKLLTIPNSELARILKFSLHGLQATLQAALQATSEDTGTKECQELLTELELLLTSSSALNEFFEPVQPSSSSVEKPLTRTKLQKKLEDNFQENPELEPYLGKVQLQSTDDAELWHEVQRLLLRVPATMAQDWLLLAQQLFEQAGAEADVTPTRLKTLPWISTLAADTNSTEVAIVYPGLTGTIPAPGLCLSKQASFDTQLSTEDLPEDLDLLARIVTVCLNFVDQPDRELHYALQSIDPFRLRSLTSLKERRKYINALLDRFKRVQIAEKSRDKTVILSARIDLDEAIHSLVYLPPVDRDTSWWGKLQQTARRTLITKARQYNVQIRSLWGSYADIRKWSKNDLEIDQGGIQGEVSACLRVYTKLNEKVLPGRVIFRSSR